MNYSKRVKRILADAINSAKENGQNSVQLEHLFLAFLEVKDGKPINFLASTGVEFDDFKNFIYSKLEIEKNNEENESDPPFNNELEVVLNNSKSVAINSAHGYIGDMHLFFALLNSSKCENIFENFSVNIQELKFLIEQELNIKQQEDQDTKNEGSTVQAGQATENETTQTLWNKYAKDLNSEYRNGKLNPMIGREKELERIIYILSRKTKNNPILLGDAGVGKTAIVEGLAERIEQKNVPVPLQNKTIFVLDLASVVAGTKFRGQFESRIKALISEVEKNKEEYIVFIDEIHTLMGAGSAEGSFDASNILKPALARGDFPCIGATTTQEYNKYLRKDLAIRRRFQPVEVPETSKDETLKILQRASKTYGDFHGVSFKNEALESIFDLSDKYIVDRYFPDKAIDLLDECGAFVKLKKFDISDTEYAKEKHKIEKEIQEAIEKEKYSRLNDLKASLKEVDKKITNLSNKKDNSVQEVNVEDVIKVISSWSKVPEDVIKQQKNFDINTIKNKLNDFIIGQNEAVNKICFALKKSKTPFKDSNRPIGSFLFSGNTGTGKTYIAKCLAKEVFGSENNLITFNMSEYTTSGDVSKLLGASPQYVGYEDGHRFQEIQKRPYSVVLFDEIEKADSSIWNILLSILSDGYIVDSLGETISFKNTIIVISSNVKIEVSSFSNKFSGFESKEEQESDLEEDKIRSSFANHFPPEFINRLDFIIKFDNISVKDCIKIAELQLKLLQKEIGSDDFSFTWTPNVVKYIGKKGQNEKYNARNINRIVENEVKDLLIHTWSDGLKSIKLGVKNKKLIIKNYE